MLRKGALLSVRAVAAHLGVSMATVYKLCASGALPHLRVSNAIRLALDDLAAYVALRGRGRGTRAQSPDSH